MKNLFIGLGVLAMIGATSCKKEYTCTCTWDDDGSEYIAPTTIKAKKSKAQEECDKNISVSFLGVSSTVEGVTCEVK